jgi:hypothetical protein
MRMVVECAEKSGIVLDNRDRPSLWDCKKAV